MVTGGAGALWVEGEAAVWQGRCTPPPNPVGGPNPPPAGQHQPVPEDAPQPSGLTAAFARYRTLNPPPAAHGHSYGEWDDALSKTALLRRTVLLSAPDLRQLTVETLQTYVTAPDPIKEGSCDLIL
ncbi:Hypp3006 [Branchiostoma lanceolatum]|uniref:Hypp3006 protein n=1 Tax=Branchiostoma lanceolatum TaxID=7740 RepID=A0A8J9ZYC1_BRALA|nr:Hypp3006 [Branchiostoma lanceolatum]